MLQVRRGDERYRGGDAQAGIDTRHAFSFSGFYDPDNTGFGLLVACNEERLAPGSGFAEHRHRDVEIVTWVVEGTLEHRDSTGGSTLVRRGDIAHLSAGAGVLHTERNAGDGPLRFVQMWLVPDVFGGDPEYQVVRGIADATPYALARAEAVLHVRRLPAGSRTAVPDAPWAHVHVVRGVVDLGGERLQAGDAARVREARDLDAGAVEPAELLVWEMHAEPSYG
jgi:redox-sensitive bicupin YhaK (pirin superfamily)